MHIVDNGDNTDFIYFSPVNVFCFFQTEDVNRTLENGRAPLHYAADFGQTDVMEYLISKGAHLNVRATTDSPHHILFALICLLSGVTMTTKIIVPLSSSLHRLSLLFNCLIWLEHCQFS